MQPFSLAQKGGSKSSQQPAPRDDTPNGQEAVGSPRAAAIPSPLCHTVSRCPLPVPPAGFRTCQFGGAITLFLTHLYTTARGLFLRQPRWHTHPPPLLETYHSSCGPGRVKSKLLWLGLKALHSAPPPPLCLSSLCPPPAPPPARPSP